MSLAWDSNEHTIESVDRVLTSEGLMPAISYLEADLQTLKDSCGRSNARGPLLFWISLGLGIVLLAGYMLWRVM